MNNLRSMKLKLDEHEKTYIKQYIKTNMRLIIVSVIILTLVVRNLVPNSIINIAFRVLGDYHYGQTQGYFNQLFMVVCVMAYMVPLYQFRFLMKRSSCDLYLSLPISRERLFDLHYLIGALFILVIGLFEGGLVLMGVALAKGITLLSMVLVVLFCVLGICLYSFFAMIVVRCNTMLDAIVVTGLFTMIPLMLHNAIQSFLVSVESEVLVAMASYSSDMLYNQLAQTITSFISIPWLLHLWVYVADYGEYALSYILLIVSTLYWFLLGSACYCWGKRFFVKSKGEDREQRTTAFLTYPFLIPAFAFVLLLQFGVGKWAWISIVIIGIIYVIALFFAQRSIRISIKHMIIYVAMVGFIVVGYQACVNTSLFHTIQEVPAVEDVISVELEVQIYDKSKNDTGQNMPIYGVTSKGQIEDTAAIQKILKGNEEIVKNIQKKESHNENLYGWINLNYTDRDFNQIYRSYRISKKEEIEYIEALIEDWINQGIDLEINKEE